MAVEQIASIPALHEEAQRLLPALKAAALVPAGEEGVQRVIAKRFPLFPQAQRSEQEWAAWWQDHFDALADLPEESLEGALATWIRRGESEFLPKPGRLREMALAEPTRAARAFDRANQAVKLAQERLPRPVPEPVPKAQIDAMLTGFRTDHLRREETQRRPEPPPTFGRVDETGLTAAMRDLLKARGE